MRFLRIFYEWRELLKSEYFVAGVGADQGESALNGVSVRVDEDGEQALAREVDALGGGGDGLVDFGEVADRDDFVTANRNRFGVRILRVAGEDLGVEENSLAGIFLRPERGTGQHKNEWSSE